MSKIGDEQNIVLRIIPFNYRKFLFQELNKYKYFALERAQLLKQPLSCIYPTI